MRQHVFASRACLRSMRCALSVALRGAARPRATGSGNLFAVLLVLLLAAVSIGPTPVHAAQTQQQKAAAEAAARAAAEAAKKAAAEAAKKAAQQAAAKAAAEAAAKAAQQAAAKAAAEAARKAAQQAAQKAAQQAAQKAAQEAAQRAAQKAAQEAAQKAAAEAAKKAAQQAAQKAAQQAQQKAAAPKPAPAQPKPQQTVAKPQPSQPAANKPPVAPGQPPSGQNPANGPQEDHGSNSPDVPEAAHADQADRQRANVERMLRRAERDARRMREEQERAVTKSARQAQEQLSKQAQAKNEAAARIRAQSAAQSLPTSEAPAQAGIPVIQPPPSAADAQRTQIDDLLRHAERAASERREQRRKLDELRRREAQASESGTPVIQLGESPASAAGAQAQQRAQIEELRAQLLRAELGRRKERQQLEDLKRRQEQIVEAAGRPQLPAPPPAPGQSPTAPPFQMPVQTGGIPATGAPAQAEPQSEAASLEADIADLKQKQERWDQRRLERSKRIEELVEQQKARAALAAERAADGQGPDGAASGRQLDDIARQARRMALGHRDEMQPPATAGAPTRGSDAVMPGDAQTGAAAPPPQSPDVRSIDQPASGATTSNTTKDPAAAPTAPDKAAPPPTKEAETAPAGSPAAPAPGENAWQPSVVPHGDEVGVTPVKAVEPPVGWAPEVVTAVVVPEAPPSTTPPTSVAGEAPKPDVKDATPAPVDKTGRDKFGRDRFDGDKKGDKNVDEKQDPEPPQPPSESAQNDNKSDDQDDEPGKPNAQKNKKKRPASSGDKPGYGHMGPPPAAEILATDLGPADIKVAQELGLEPVSPKELRNLGLSVTRLKVPRGRDAAALRRELRKRIPRAGLAANETYWIFGARRGGEMHRPLRRALDDAAKTKAAFGPSPATGGAAAAAGGTDSSATESTVTDSSAAVGTAADALVDATTDAVTDVASNAIGESVEESVDGAGTASSATSETEAEKEAEADSDTDADAEKSQLAARGDDDTQPSKREPIQKQDFCKGEQCFASTLIKWHGDLRSCSKDVKVGVIDTSFDITHPAFRRLKRSSGEFLNGEAPSTHDWHGTAVLSLLGGDPASSTPGLIPDASFYLATAFKTDEAGNASTDTMRLLQALDWLDALDVRFINMSFSGPRDPLFEKAIQRMQAKGVVFVAAAGNQGPTAPPSYPAAYPQVIAVTAVNKNAENYRHANRGDYVDLSAPGVGIMTALPDAKQGLRTGTSFAAPFVTAIMATRPELASAAYTKKSDLLHRLNMQDLGPPGPDPIYGQGLALAPKVCTGTGATIAQQPPPQLKRGLSFGAAAAANASSFSFRGSSAGP